MIDDWIFLGGMYLAILLFLAFDYKRHSRHKSLFFGLVYSSIGPMIAVLAGYEYNRTSNFYHALCIYSVGLSFAVLGMVVIVDILLEMIVDVITKVRKLRRERE